MNELLTHDKIDLEALIHKHEGLLRSMSRRYNVRGYEEDDLYQEFVMVLIDCTRKFDTSRKVKFSTYLYKSIQSRIYQLIRKQPDKTVEMDDNTPTPWYELAPDAQDAKDETERALMEALDNLKNGHITKMLLFENMTLQEVGDTIGKTKQRALQIHQENLEALRALL